MSQVGVRALKQNASAVVARAAGGEVVVITDRGRAVARLVPLTADPIEALITAGLARPAKRSLTDLGAPSRPAPGEPSLSAALANMRADERY